jgi:hypothetical protein
MELPPRRQHNEQPPLPLEGVVDAPPTTGVGGNGSEITAPYSDPVEATTESPAEVSEAASAERPEIPSLSPEQTSRLKHIGRKIFDTIRRSKETTPAPARIQTATDAHTTTTDVQPVPEVEAAADVQPVAEVKAVTDTPTETMDMADDSAYVADMETVDTLRHELSSISPGMQKNVHKLTQLVTTHTLDTYGDLIPVPTRDLIEHIPDRVIVTDPEAFDTFAANWVSSEEAPHASAGGLFHGLGHIIVTKDPSIVVQNIPAGLVRRIAGRDGPDRIVGPEAISVLYQDTLSHEPFHALQDQDLPWYVSEIGAYFYQTEIQDTQGIPGLDTLHKVGAADFYGDLIDKYGDDVHRLFFGSLSDNIRRNQILAEFTPWAPVATNKLRFV